MVAGAVPVEMVERGRSPLRRKFFFTLIVLAGLAWAAWWGAQRVTWYTPAGGQIAPVVREAMTIGSTGFTPPQAYLNIPMTRANFVAFGRSTQRRLAQLYTGAALARWRGVARSTLNPRDFRHGKTSQWISPWRVDWIHLEELRMLPGSSTATATASVEVSSRGGALNRMDYTFHLVHSAVGWRIAADDWQFEPGYGP